MFAEYDRFDGLALAQLVKTSQVSSAELVAEMRARIDARNPAINAVVGLFENELEKAPSSEGSFAGLPMLLKDLNIYVEGQITANGSRSMQSLVADRDSALVERYRRAGMVIAGQTNSPEFGLSPTTEPLLNGPTHNPWKRGYSAGGSSGGAAAAVAAGIVPFAHASDGGGSIRIPAAACGLFGLKPSRGRISPAPQLGEGWNGLSTSHVVTRSVRDSAALLDISHGYVLGDPYSAPSVEGTFLEASQREPGPLRVAYATSNPVGLPLHEDCIAAVLDAAQLCDSLGHNVEETSPSYDAQSLSAASYGIIGPHIVATLREIEARLGRPIDEDELEDITRMMRDASQTQTASEYVDAQRSMHRLTRELAPFWQTHDVYLTPTLGQPPQPHDSLLYREGMDYLEYGTRMATYVPFTTLANITGQPSMSVPLFWNDEQIPVGVMCTGAYGAEATLYSLAGQLEAARPWSERRPLSSA
jgi:amidase/6-aminohexanoate-cyclic-dimer hydrolase